MEKEFLFDFRISAWANIKIEAENESEAKELFNQMQVSDLIKNITIKDYDIDSLDITKISGDVDVFDILDELELDEEDHISTFGTPSEIASNFDSFKTYMINNGVEDIKEINKAWKSFNEFCEEKLSELNNN